MLNLSVKSRLMKIGKHKDKTMYYAQVETFARQLVCILFVNSLYNRELFCIFEY